MQHRRPLALVMIATLAVTALAAPALARPSDDVPSPGTSASLAEQPDAGPTRHEAGRILLGRTDGTVTRVDAVAGADGTARAPGTSGLAAAIEPPATDGTPRGVHVRRARFAGQTDDGVRAADLARDVTALVDPYFDDSTGGALRYTVASQGNPAASPPTVESCDWRDAWDVARWAEDLVGAGLQDRDEHLVLYTPAVEGCDIAWFSDLDAAVTWIAGDVDDETRWQTVAKSVAGDVMLHRSDTRNCGAGLSFCTSGHRGDAYDVLGAGTGPLNGAHLDWLGLLDAESAVRPSGPTEVELEPMGGLEGRRVVVLPGRYQDTYVEYRGAVGRDADLAEGRLACATAEEGPVPSECEQERFTTGVVIHEGLRRKAGDPSWTWLQDASVGDASWEEGDPRFVLRPGRSFVTRDGLWVVTTVGVGATATVRVAPNTVPQPTNVSVEGAEMLGYHWTSDDSTVVRWDVDASAVVGGFDVLVDGVVRASVPADARSATVPVALGTQRVLVRAIGAPGWRDSDYQVVVRDEVAPWFSTLPRAEVRTGPVTTSSAPVRLRWHAEDDHVLRSIVVRDESGARTLGATVRQHDLSAAPGTRSWTVEAYDGPRNSRSVTLDRRVEVRGEKLAAHTGRWASQTNTRFTHGTAMRASTAGASFSFTTTARSVGWTAYTSPASGRATVYVDGTKAAVVDLRSQTAGSKVVFAKNWIHPGAHTIRVVVEGTAGRPAVLSDGFVIQR